MRRYPDPDFDIGGKALLKRYNSVPAPDLDLEISGGGGKRRSAKILFLPLGPQFGLKIKRGGGGGGGVLPWIRQCDLNLPNLNIHRLYS